MPIDESLANAKSGIALVGEMIKIAGDNPNVREAGSNLGHTALTITKTINNALLPLAAVNFAFDKARLYFAEKFERDLSQKASAIPLDKIVEPKASIAGPTLQGLAFTHEEINLKDMYLSLLATAMDSRIANEAHPAFVEIIKQLNSEEASLIREILQASSYLGIINVNIGVKGEQGTRSLQRNLMNLAIRETSRAIENPRFSAMIDNWIRLGLVEVDYGKKLSNADAYDWVADRPEVARYRQECKETEDIRFEHGVISRTALGLQFSKCVGLA